MRQEIIVRNYCSRDLKKVTEIMLESRSPTGRTWSKRLVKQMFSDALKEQPDGVFVAEINGVIGGFAIVMFREWLGIAYLDYIQAKMQYMNRGVGHKLIEKCLSWARDKGARIIYTETGKNNEGAISFYQKHGFHITGSIPEYYRKGLDAVIFVRKMN